jgi:excisionase family DNA binding protein
VPSTPEPPTNTPITATVLPPTNTPPTVATPDIDALFEAEMKKLNGGEIQYNPPPEMTVDEGVIVEAYITRGTSQNLPTPVFRGPGAPITATLTVVSSLMNVTLSGDEGKFKITDNVQEQSVNKDTYTRWWWNVVPLATGVYTLSITVKAKIEIPGSPVREKINDVKDAKIQVKVNPAYSIKQFIQLNWQWLATAVIIPLGIFGWNKRKNKKEPQTPVVTALSRRPDTMLSTREVAEQLNISATAVRELILSGALPSFRIRDQLRIKQKDIDEYLEHQRANREKT